MKKDTAKSLRAFAVELVIYSVLVTVYFFLVLHLLGEWLYHLEAQHRYMYALVALLLIAGQAVALDAVTTLLFRLLLCRWRSVMFLPISDFRSNPIPLFLVAFT